MTEPRVFRPGNSSHSNKKASGTPIAAASATLATEIQTLAHSTRHSPGRETNAASASGSAASCTTIRIGYSRSEEHTSELQSRFDLVCRLLLEKKKKIQRNDNLAVH